MENLELHQLIGLNLIGFVMSFDMLATIINWPIFN